MKFKHAVLGDQTEEEFQNQVVAFARLFGWKCAHFRAVCVRRKNGSYYYETPVAADGKGWLDWVFAKDRLLFVELKSVTGKLTPEQKEWIKRLERAGQDARVWTPKDWEEIEKELSA